MTEDERWEDLEWEVGSGKAEGGIKNKRLKVEAPFSSPSEFLTQTTRTPHPATRNPNLSRKI